MVNIDLDKLKKFVSFNGTQLSMEGFCCREVKDPIHEVVHRSDARAGEKVLKHHGGMVE